jgi:aspartate 4-decarboxylase
LTDDVYGTFADDFVSLFALAPRNTILVYSYSKYFGATGWRLGAIATHRDDVLDTLISELPKDVNNELHTPLFSLFSLMDTPDAYKNALKRLIRHRKQALYKEIGISFEDVDPNRVDYYAILDLEFLGERAHGREFVDWLIKKAKPSELLFRARGAGRVVAGARVRHAASVWTSVPRESHYRKIGRALRTLLAEYVDRYNAATGKKLDRNKVL